MVRQSHRQLYNGFKDSKDDSGRGIERKDGLRKLGLSKINAHHHHGDGRGSHLNMSIAQPLAFVQHVCDVVQLGQRQLQRRPVLVAMWGVLDQVLLAELMFNSRQREQ